MIGVDRNRDPDYKDNKVLTTSAKDAPKIVNHIIELDDTPANERILVKHKSGSYVEFFSDGNLVAKASNSSYDIAINNKEIFVNGDTIINCGKTAKITAKSIVLNGDVTIFGNLSTRGIIRSAFGETGSITDTKGQTFSISGGLINKITTV
jgi:hypothetical protein